ncbi:MAG: hypothetical protein HY981_03900 [Candidatus Magasanikbacteria bacterium]|nr:hypothetical protein [Candidatus Magasanikbacteria bacterium]
MLYSPSPEPWKQVNYLKYTVDDVPANLVFPAENKNFPVRVDMEINRDNTIDISIHIPVHTVIDITVQRGGSVSETTLDDGFRGLCPSNIPENRQPDIDAIINLLIRSQFSKHGASYWCRGIEKHKTNIVHFADIKDTEDRQQ